MRVTSPVEPALGPRLGPLTFWRSQCGPIPVGQSSLLCGRHPHLSPPDPQITADLLSNGIDVYPQKEFDEDPEDRLVNEKFRVSALAVPGGPRFLLEATAGSSYCSSGTGEASGMGLSHGNVFSGPEGVRAQVFTWGSLGPRVSVLGGPGLRAAPPRGPGSSLAFAHT